MIEGLTDSPYMQRLMAGDEWHDSQRLIFEGEKWVRRIARGATQAEAQRFVRYYGPTLAKLRRRAGVEPVPVYGSTERGAKWGYFRAPLRDGTTGYLQRRVDDCWTFGVASLLQIPPYRVPDLHLFRGMLSGTDPELIDRKADVQIELWEKELGVRLMVSPTPTWNAKRWIGVTTTGVADAHCLVMAGRECIFDPCRPFPALGDEPVTVADPKSIDYAIVVKE